MAHVCVSVSPWKDYLTGELRKTEKKFVRLLSFFMNEEKQQ